MTSCSLVPEIAEQKAGPDTENYEKKAFSCLHLISAEAFAAGIARMKRDLELEPISCISRNYVVWNEKSANKPVEQTACR